jgi:hypothetical protein
VRKPGRTRRGRAARPERQQQDRPAHQASGLRRSGRVYRASSKPTTQSGPRPGRTPGKRRRTRGAAGGFAVPGGDADRERAATHTTQPDRRPASGRPFGGVRGRGQHVLLDQKPARRQARRSAPRPTTKDQKSPALARAARPSVTGS